MKFNMKCFPAPVKGKTTVVDLSVLIDRIMSPERSHGSFEGINMEGRNNGAVMITKGSSSGESSNCCSINIYVNNNVQGINNSILVGSKVNMGDLGVWLSLKDAKFGRGGSLGAKMKRDNSAFGFYWVVITIFAMLFLFLSLI